MTLRGIRVLLNCNLNCNLCFIHITLMTESMARVTLILWIGTTRLIETRGESLSEQPKDKGCDRVGHHSNQDRERQHPFLWKIAITRFAFNQKYSFDTFDTYLWYGNAHSKFLCSIFVQQPPSSFPPPPLSSSCDIGAGGIPDVNLFCLKAPM